MLGINHHYIIKWKYMQWLCKQIISNSNVPWMAVAYVGIHCIFFKGKLAKAKGLSLTCNRWAVFSRWRPAGNVQVAWWLWSSFAPGLGAIRWKEGRWNFCKECHVHVWSISEVSNIHVYYFFHSSSVPCMHRQFTWYCILYIDLISIRILISIGHHSRLPSKQIGGPV